MPAKSLLLLPSALDACLPGVRNMCHIEQFTWSFLLFHWPVVTHVGVQDMFSMSCTIVSWPTHQSLYSFFSPSSPTSQPLSDSMISQLDHHYQLDTNTPPRPPLSYSTASPHPTLLLFSLLPFTPFHTTRVIHWVGCCDWICFSLSFLSPCHFSYV